MLLIMHDGPTLPCPIEGSGWGRVSHLSLIVGLGRGGYVYLQPALNLGILII